jgi:hypothetical protein
MNIPLDRLYHYINNIAQEIYGDRVIIYRFWPNGSKNIQDLKHLMSESTWFEIMTLPLLWCNDQEPLDYEFYKNNIFSRFDSDWQRLLISLNLFVAPTNLNYQKNIFEKGLLLHSEKRSHNLKKYQHNNELIPVYYWSHAVIARNWFRYAKYETFQKNTKKTFLIYNRAWSGTREYRLYFSNLLIDCGLVEQCQTNCNPVDPSINLHYSDYKFNNPQWQPTHVLENFLQPTTADSNSSADFFTVDYDSTDIEIVLETLFDDTRLHLTEKSLRPIACRQPFILASTQGSLEYLRSYGFKTFDTVWDESYDQIVDPKERLLAITSLMKQIAGWDPITRSNKMALARSIANYNHQWFFSKEFIDLIINELKTNLKSAFEELKQCDNYKTLCDRWAHLTSYSEINEYLKNNQNIKYPAKESVEAIMNLAKKQLTEVANTKKI